MNAKTLKALKGSIAKWKAIVAGTGADKGVDNCPLCKLFFGSGPMCFGCPVAEKAGCVECRGTPYVAWSDATHHRYNTRADTPRKVKIARAELRFLESLLPKKRK